MEPTASTLAARSGGIRGDGEEDGEGGVHGEDVR